MGTQGAQRRLAIIDRGRVLGFGGKAVAHQGRHKAALSQTLHHGLVILHLACLPAAPMNVQDAGPNPVLVRYVNVKLHVVLRVRLDQERLQGIAFRRLRLHRFPARRWRSLFGRGFRVLGTGGEGQAGKGGDKGKGELHGEDQTWQEGAL